MRIIVPLVTALVSLAPAQARDFLTGDGQFTLCPFRQFRDCELLTDQMKQGNRFSPEEKRMLDLLKSVTDKAPATTIADLEKIFGKPTNVLDMTGLKANSEPVVGLVWLTDPKGGCPICGVHAMITNRGLTVIHYSVANKFIVSWSSTAR